MRRVCFEDNNAMWAFIKGNKRKKFDFDGVKDALWFSVEKTDEERFKTAKVSYLINTVVTFLVDSLEISTM